MPATKGGHRAGTIPRGLGNFPALALNTFRYRMAGVDDQQGAADDASRLLALGVRHFQIDSIYEHHLRR